MSAWESDEHSFAEIGLRGRDFFLHDVVELAKPYPDALLLMDKRGFAPEEISRGTFRQLNLYARATEDFPAELFTDSDVNWHHQQFGRRGLIAAVGVYLEGNGRAMVTLIQSDVMQQVHRSAKLRHCKSRLENRFRAWPLMALHALLSYGARGGISEVLVPTSETLAALLKSPVDARLFQRIYDRYPVGLGAARVVRRGRYYWRIEVDEARLRGIGRYRLVPAATPDPRPAVCLMHDIEENVDVPLSASQCRENLENMLQIERGRAIRGTYNILGRIYSRVSPAITRDGHAVGFHSHDHRIDRQDQLPRVRQVDLQVKGYRPPRSILTPELEPRTLSYWNFEWLASSVFSLGRDTCYVAGGVVHIPIAVDDYPLYKGGIGFDAWCERLLHEVENHRFYAFSVHDCYADSWLDGYDELLACIDRIARWVTADDVAGLMFAEAASTIGATPAP